jgi:choline dehydrogenase-like flavoprotein
MPHRDGQMTRSLIVGSGASAAGAALALLADPLQEVSVIDIGHRLDASRREAIDRMAATSPSLWNESDLSAIRTQPVGRRTKGLPQKRSYGSAYPFADVGQLHDVIGAGHANGSVISAAYGGLTNVWGAQVMPFSRSTFADWPVDYATMEPHYRAVLESIPYAAEEDSLAENFPLVIEGQCLPPLAPRTAAVLANVSKHEASLRRLGVAVGRARLAFQSRACVRCGLCMTGCPYSLIYSASQTFDRLRREHRIRYHEGLLAVEVGQAEDVPYLIAKDVGTGAFERFEADRIYIGCGAVGTTRLVLSSLNVFDQDIEMRESAQFVIPMASRIPTPDPRGAHEFTLNQFNMTVSLDDKALDISQIHFYPHNDALVDALPSVLRSRLGSPIAGHLLRRLTVGLGYLPSWESPAMRVRITKPSKTTDLPGIIVSGDQQSAFANSMFRQVALRMLKVAPKLDLWPVLPMAFLSAPGKSYHFGGSLPHRLTPVDGPLTTDLQGRLRQWSRVHMVDASVFPTVPATTFTLTIMANAHRIATDSLRTSL